MTSVFRCFSTVLCVVAAGCTPTDAPKPPRTPLSGDSVVWPTIDVKERIGYWAQITAVALIDYEPDRLTTGCTLEIPTPPPGWTVKPGYAPNELRLFAPQQGDVWLPPNQPPMQLPQVVQPFGVENPNLLLAGFIKQDLVAQDQGLREIGFTGDPLALNCGGQKHYQYVESGIVLSDTDLLSDGTTLDEIKELLTEVAGMPPMLNPNRVISINTNTEPPN
jgi:hypothetical protein